MEHSTTNEKKLIKIREKVYKEIARSPKDLSTLKALLVKKKIVESGSKFDKAVEMLKESDRITVKGGYAMVNPKDIKHGVYVSCGQNGYVLLDGDSRQYAIYQEDSEGLFSNDRVSVGFTEDGSLRRPFIISREKNSGEISSSSYKDQILGRVVKISHDKLVFIPNDKKFTKSITLLNQKSALSQYQDKICLLKLVENEKNGLPACGMITEVIGDAGNPIHEYEAIAKVHGANMNWSDEQVKAEIAKLPSEVDLTGKGLVDEQGKVLQEGEGKVVDLRKLCFTTVDPATCKDMDDAIYSSFDDDGHLVVYTAIANVSKYVSLDSEIGRRYLSAGFTTYAPNRAYNILPPELSTGICSLNPNEDRLALVIKTIIDEKTGIPISSEIMDGVINSKEKYSYEEAQKICDENPTSLEELKDKFKNENLTKEEQVLLNAKAAKVLWKGFNKRNLIKFETKNEYDVIFNDDFSDIVDIVPQENCAYHKVIEAFMLTANEASASFAKEHHVPNIYRVHDMPNENKVEQAYEFFGNLNIPFDGDLTPLGISRILSSVKGTRKEKMVNNFLVRLQARAKYSNSTNPNANNFKGKNIVDNQLPEEIENSFVGNKAICHFGLQSIAYSHTTSPIRRISDYVTHYNILSYLEGREPINEIATAQIAQWANEMQDSNKHAEREFIEVNSAIYCEGHIGDVLRGNISGFRYITNAYGSENSFNNLIIIVENEEKGIRVQIPASEFISNGGKNIGISPYGSAIINKNSGKVLIRLCDDVAFKIQSADRVTRLITATLDLEMDNDLQEEFYDLEQFTKVLSNPTLSAKRQRMLAEVRYKKEYKNRREYKEELDTLRGEKYTKHVKTHVGVDIDGNEAYRTNNRAKQIYGRKKALDSLNSRDYYEDERY